MTHAVAPAATANCSARPATPPPMPVTRTVSPGFNPPWVNTARQAVTPASGSAAACGHARCAG
ncbi:MAG TPA: hypothetical protein VEJ18_04805, partial [Planctomycetota bacterium]|nr:hypothetical protein [Planctomycetota bacterium]